VVIQLLIFRWTNIGKKKEGVDPQAVQYARALRPPYHLLSFLRIHGNSSKGSSSTNRNTMVKVQKFLKHWNDKLKRKFCSFEGIHCLARSDNRWVTPNKIGCQGRRFFLHSSKKLLQPHKRHIWVNIFF